MEGGTTFHFVTDGIHSALEQAKAAAGDKDVRVGGGVATIRQYCRRSSWTRCIWQSRRCCLERARTFCGIDMLKLGYECTEQVATELATHVVITRT